MRLRNKAAAGPAEAGELVGNGRRYGDEAYARRLESLLRASLALGGLGLGFAGMAVSGALALLPLKTTEHVLVQFDQPSAQLVRLIPERIDRGTVEQLTEAMLRRYVADRQTINHTDETARFEWVRAHTADKPYRDFRDLMVPSNPDSPLVDFRKKGLTREIHVLSVGRVPGGSNTWQVEFTTIDRRGPTMVQRGEWVATVIVYRQAIEGSAEIAQMNPLGLTVTGYAIRKRSLGAGADLGAGAEAKL